ncbi:MAG: SusC/RagA family TonB-linked outer membrane protein [Flavobacteriaceae bacterium]
MKTTLKGILTLFLALVVQVTFAQDKTISGTVTDQNNVPLGGVNILVQGTANGTQSDFDGNYTITASEGKILVFSYIGRTQATAVVGASNVINIQMQEDAQALEEVVVSALGVTREKKALGYSQQTVQGENLVQTKEVDLNTALSGKIAGVQMVGAPSSTFDAGLLRLRGETGVLYVVDGVKVYSQTDINTDNIGNISVLKGASATALFGVDARNGVVLITSKTAKAGQTSLSIDHTTSMTSVSLLPDYQNEYGGGYYQDWDTFSYNPATDPAEWAAFEGQKIPYYAADESWGPRLDGTLVRHWDSWIPGSPSFGELRPWSPNPDNVKNFFQDAITNNTSLNWSKGGDDYKVSAAVRNINTELVLPNSFRNQIDINLNASFDFNKKLNMYTTVNYQTRVTENEPAQGYGTSLGSNFNQWFQRQLDMDRLKDLYNQDGTNYSWNIRSPRNSRPLYWDAPHFGVDNNNTNQRKDVLYGNFGLNYQLTDNIKMNLEARRRNNNYFSDARTAFGGLSTPRYSESRSRYEQNELFGYANYVNRFLGDALDLDVKVGFQLQENKDINTSANSVGGLSVPDFYSIATSVDRPSYSTGFTNSKINSAFTSVSMGYNSTFYLDASYRLDWGSTANPENNRLETYGVSGVFIFNQFLNVDAISFAKLRASVAQAPIFPNPYQTTSIYNVGSPYGGNASFSVPNTQSNPMLLGGTRNETEFGLEMKFLKNRLGLDLTYFQREDSQLPVAIPVSGASGFTGLSINSGKTSSNGLELSISGTPIQAKDITWDVAVNFSTLEKTVDFIYEGIEKNILQTLSWYSLQLQEIVGEEWGTFVGRKRSVDENGNWILNANGSHVYETNQKLGNVLPDFTGGFSSTFRYKNFFLFTGLDFQKGGLFFSTTNQFAAYSGIHADTAGNNDIGNPLRDDPSDGGGVHVVGVDKTGATVDTYREASTYFGGLFGAHDAWLYDATYIKLRQVRLGYTLPNALLSKTPFKKVDLSIIGNNLLLLYSDVPGLDPSEIEGSGTFSSPYRAVEGGQLPPARTLGLNIKINF